MLFFGAAHHQQQQREQQQQPAAAAAAGQAPGHPSGRVRFQPREEEQQQQQEQQEGSMSHFTNSGTKTGWTLSPAAAAAAAAAVQCFGVAKGVFRRLAAPAPAAPAAGAAVAPVMFPSEDQQQQQQQKHLQQQALCFYQNPEEMSSLGTACFWRSFRPSSFLWVSEVTFGIRRKSSSRSSRRVLWFWASGGRAAAATGIEPSCCSCCCCCSSSQGWKRTLPDGETQWPWRTEQRQNRAQKVPNVPSETLEKQQFWIKFWTRFYSFQPIFIPLFVQWDIEPFCCSCCCCCSSEAENAPSRTGKHSGPEGRNSAKIEPKKCLTSLLKP